MIKQETTYPFYDVSFVSLYKSLELFEESANRAKKSIRIGAMYVPAGDDVAERVCKVLRAGARRDVPEVELFVGEFMNQAPDTYTKVHAFRSRTPEEREKDQANKAMVKDLRDAGVNVLFTKVPGADWRRIPFPFTGQDHSKWWVVDGQDGAILEGNLSGKRDFTYANNAFIYHGGNLPLALDEYAEKIKSGDLRQDYIRHIDDKTSLLVDSGVEPKLFGVPIGIPGSIIIRHERQLIEHATPEQKIFFASQFPVSEPLLWSFQKAARHGVESNIYLSANCRGGFAAERFQKSVRPYEDFIHVFYYHGGEKSTEGEGKIHSKVLLVWEKDGGKIIFTSNNGHIAGRGTRENGIMSTDSRQVIPIYGFFEGLDEQSYLQSAA